MANKTQEAGLQPVSWQTRKLRTITLFVTASSIVWHAQTMSKSHDLDEFLVCGRKANAPLVAFSILASCIGGSATIGMAGLAWQCGTPAFWWLGTGVIGLIILGLFVAKKYRQTGARTMPEIIAHYLGPQCAYISALLILFANVAIIAAQFSAMGLIVASLTGIGSTPALLLSALCLLSYTFLGGQQAVMRSDLWQFCVLFGALLLAFGFLCQNSACQAALLSSPIQIVNENFSWSRFRYFLIIIGTTYIICPMLCGRILSAKNGKTARNGALWAALGLTIVAVLITAIGIALQGLELGNIAPQKALTTGIAMILPEWGAYAVTLGLLSAIVSSADSCLLTAAAVGANDLNKAGGLQKIRIWLVLVTFGAVLIALHGKSLIGLLLAANDIFVAGMVGPTFVALMAGPQQGARRRGFLLAMLLGGLLGIGGATSGNPDYSMAGFGLALGISCFSALPWLTPAFCKK